MDDHFPYIFGGFLILGGIVTAWIAPDLKDDDHPNVERTPRQRLMFRLVGVAFILVGITLVLATFFGVLPKSDGEGPLF